MSAARADDTGPVAAPVASRTDALAAGIAARIRELEALFERIAATRMLGVPILHPGLAVKAVGFRPDADGGAAVGVLVTPWFMNLVWLPLGEASVATPATPAPDDPDDRDEAADVADAGSAAESRWVVAGGVSASPSGATASSPTPVGVTRTRAVGHERFDFIGTNETGFGAFEACSLFSPMGEFADQAAAVATAEEVMRLLYAPPAHPSQGSESGSEARPGRSPATSRRALLFGRPAAAEREGGR